MRHVAGIVFKVVLATVFWIGWRRFFFQVVGGGVVVLRLLFDARDVRENGRREAESEETVSILIADLSR